MQTLEFNNRFTAELPADPVTDNHRRQVSDALYSRVMPTPVSAPQLIAYSREAAALIGLSDADVASGGFVQVFAGNAQHGGMDPHATCYGGHQFGNWAGQLGDGRAINLGEVEHAGAHWMLQLKGAGPTPYSRTADGLAVLRSSTREFLCSEAMHHLGIPTTRALSLIGTGEEVIRDMLYDGHPKAEPGAVVCRLSSSFVRFGHLQMLAAREEIDLLRTFTDFVIEREFPTIDANGKDRYVALFREVSSRTADMIVHWMRVGFVHGVMNTDNMSILGETIDYGPYGWLDDFDPDWTPNTTDAGQRRYRYGQQPAIGQWNLMQLANALLPIVGETQPLEQALSDYARRYEQQWQVMMAAKLGLNQYDGALIDELLLLLTSTATDMTRFFRALASVEPDRATLDALLGSYYEPPSLQDDFKRHTDAWLKKYARTLGEQNVTEKERSTLMKRTNPKYVLRNYLAQLAIDAAEQGDFSKINETLEVMRRPYDEQPEFEAYADLRPDWAKTRVGCSMLSCSS